MDAEPTDELVMVTRGVRRGSLTTREAAAYCGFKTTGALRKAHLEGRVFPLGRRGGRGTWMWAIEDLDRFIAGQPPARLPSDRSGAPSLFAGNARS